MGVLIVTDTERTTELINRFKKYQEDYKKNQNDILIVKTRLGDLLDKVNTDTVTAKERLGLLPDEVQQNVKDIIGQQSLTINEDNIKEVANVWREIYAFLQDYCDKALTEAEY